MVTTVPGRSAAELVQGSSEEEVDPLAEAEVYLSYGRDAQAEEILREAVARQPGRNELRMKLLEIYMKRVDRSAFEGIATELFAATGGQGPDWLKAAEMGVMIDPDNPLYAAGRSNAQRSGSMDATIASAAGAATIATAAAAARAMAEPSQSIAPTEAFDAESTSVLGTMGQGGAAAVDFDLPVQAPAPEPAPLVSDFDSTMLAVDAATPGNTGDMDFTLDFDAPGGDGPPPTRPHAAARVARRRGGRPDGARRRSVGHERVPGRGGGHEQRDRVPARRRQVRRAGYRGPIGQPPGHHDPAEPG